MNLELTILVNDSVSRSDLQPEHGLAMLLKTTGKTFLIDAGATGDALLANASVLGIELDRIDGLILTHGHRDHTGGAAHVAHLRRGLHVFAHPGAFDKRWIERPGEPLKELTCPHSAEKLIDLGAVWHAVRSPRLLEPGILLTGPIGGPRWGSESFAVRRNDDIVADLFQDELCVVVRARRGWVIVSGCCHRGLPNTLKTIRFLTHGEPLIALVGGLHLRSCNEPQLQAVVSLLGEFGNPAIYPCHCTGDQAVEYLRRRLGDQVRPIEAGSVLHF